MGCYCGHATKASKIKWLLAFVFLFVGAVLLGASVGRFAGAISDYDGADLLLLCSSAVI